MSQESVWHFHRIGISPWIAALPPASRHLHDLTWVDDRLYLSYGDSDANLGPVEIGAYIPRRHAFVTEALLGSEATGRFKQIGDQWMVPASDPAHFYNQADLAIRTAEGHWIMQRQIGMLHAYDVTELNQSLFLTGSSRDLREGQGANTLVWESLDHGHTWKPFLRTTLDPNAFGRSRYAIPYQNQIYFTGKAIDGTRCTLLEEGTLPIAINAYAPFLGQTLYLEGTPGEPPSKPSLLWRFDGQESRAIPHSCLDLEVHNDRLWLLLADGTLLATTDLSTWVSAPISVFPMNASRIAITDQSIFVGTTEGDLWMGTMSKEPPFDGPPGLDWNRTTDAGQSLVYHGNTLYFGAPASGVDPWNHGIVHAADRPWVLPPPIPRALGYFGAHLAMGATWMAISEPARGRESIHLFVASDLPDSPWIWTETLRTNQPIHSLSSDGHQLIVGWEGQANQAHSPAATIFASTDDGWRSTHDFLLGSFQQQLDPETYIQTQVAKDGPLCVLGLVGDPADDKGRGSVAIYHTDDSSTSLRAILPEPYSESGFGSVIAISDQWLAIGAPRGDGKVHLFTRQEGQIDPDSHITLTSPDAHARFGHAITLQERFLAVGAPEAQWSKGASGRVFVYDLEGGTPTLRQRLFPKGSERGFGNRLASNEEGLAIGSLSGHIREEQWRAEFSLTLSGTAHSLKLTWPTERGKHYRLEGSHRLDSVTWELIATAVGTGEPHIHPISQTDQQGFYRVVRSD